MDGPGGDARAPAATAGLDVAALAEPTAVAAHDVGASAGAFVADTLKPARRSVSSS
ncbi:MAG TPA: hypothetical protein VGO31_12295 [Microbacteriaceae bacterium]|nr:hypothetical protein [Microbacteriaceae bacterium]